MSANLLISKYLSEQAQTELLTDLLTNEKFDEVLEILSSGYVAISTDAAMCNLIFEKLCSKLIKKIDQLSLQNDHVYQFAGVIEDAELKSLAELACKVPTVWILYEAWLVEELMVYIQEKKWRLFQGGSYDDIFLKLAHTSCEPDTTRSKKCYDIKFLIMLKIVELSYQFENEMNKLPCGKLDRVILGLLVSDDEAVVSTCSNLIKWRTNTICEACHAHEGFDGLLWITIRYLLKADYESAWKQKVGLTFLLRFLLQSTPTYHLIDFLQSNDFWKIVQSSLAHEVQDYRKLGLSILKLSIQSLSKGVQDFQTQLFTWKASEEAKIIETWEKFTTLYEIVSLETALNQIEAASGHILELFVDPFLYPSWGLILFSTGLKASMEGIRKYVLSLLFQIENKAVFSTNVVALKTNFLPCAMEAHNFVTNGQTCPYGDKLSEFIVSVISTSEEQMPAIIEAILEVLVKYGTSYDPARIYLCYGVLKSLKKRNSRILSTRHIQFIKKLFESDSEEVIFETTIQSIYLKLLLHIDPEVNAAQWVQTIAAHIKYNANDYKYLMPLMEHFKDFAVTYFDTRSAREDLEACTGIDTTFDALSSIIFGEVDLQINQALLLEFARSNEFNNEHTPVATELLGQLLTGSADNDYENAYLLLELPCFSAETWKSVVLTPLFNSLHTNFSPQMFHFFVRASKKVDHYNLEFENLGWSQIQELYNNIRSYFKITSNPGFKIKDRAFAYYFEFVLLYLRSHALEDDEVQKLIQLLQLNVTTDNGNFEGNLGITKICTYLIDTYVVIGNQDTLILVDKIFDILCAIWEIVKSERLVLKQRDLHLSIISGLFHSNVMYQACVRTSQNSSLTAQKLFEYGQDIVIQAESRRSILPLLSGCIRNFFKRFVKELDVSKSNSEWLVHLMGSIFALQQTNVSIFKIKPVIADLYDKNISIHFHKSKGLYLEVYGTLEFSAKLSIIDALLGARDSFKEMFVTKSIEHENFLCANRKADGDEERQRILKWQLVMLAVPYVNPKDLLCLAETAIFNSLLTEFSPSIRVYMEWIISLALEKNYEEGSVTDLEDQVFSLMDDHSKPILVVGVERISFIVLKALNKKFTPNRLLKRFTCALIPNATSNKPLVRHFSNSLTLSYWPLFEYNVKDETLRNILKVLHDNADSQKTEGHYRAGDANTWNLYEDLTLTGIFGGVLKKIIDHDVPYIPRDCFKVYLEDQNIKLIGEDEFDLWLGKRANKSKDTSVQVERLTSSQFQTKSGAWEVMFDIDENENVKNVKRSDLIVVSSLVDKPPNLGGICRLCDVLGVGLLTVQDLRIKNHPQFKNVAVTADRWMPMQEVPVEGIIQFMRGKKLEGYTLIGLEQTDKSIKLDSSFKFPRKSLILLGIEALGIPGYLLAELDLCLEIKQFGVIRSMNIQTATAVIAQSYTVQHM